MNSKSVCEHLCKGNGLASPLSKLICTSYYDGPVAGLAKCSECASSYVFQMEVSDLLSDLRIFTLKAAKEGLFERIVDELEMNESPHWPVWVPRWQNKIASDTAIDELMTLGEADRCFIVVSRLLIDCLVECQPIEIAELMRLRQNPTFKSMLQKLADNAKKLD